MEFALVILYAIALISNIIVAIFDFKASSIAGGTLCTIAAVCWLICLILQLVKICIL